MGPLLRPHVRQHLSGIDLSSGMLDKARERGCYDELAVAELVEHLTAAAEAVAAQGESEVLGGSSGWTAGTGRGAC
jgi:predicted TPR repeat methyltransferase